MNTNYNITKKCSKYMKQNNLEWLMDYAIMKNKEDKDLAGILKKIQAEITKKPVAIMMVQTLLWLTVMPNFINGDRVLLKKSIKVRLMPGVQMILGGISEFNK